MIVLQGTVRGIKSMIFSIFAVPTKWNSVFK
jgi:hypothetical protein